MKLIALLLFFVFSFLSLPSIVWANYTTKLEQQINLIDQEYISTSSTYSPTDNSLGLIKYDSGVYNGESVYFEAVIKCMSCTGGNASAQAALFDSSGNQVNLTAVSASDTTYHRIRSSEMSSNLTDNTLYTVRLKLDADSGTAYIQAARLIILQSDTNITATQTQIEVGDAASFSNTEWNIMPGGVKIFHFEPQSIDPLTSIYFEATLKGSGVGESAAAALSTASDCSSVVTNTTVNVTNNNWNLNRTSNILTDLTANNNYWACIKSSSGTGGIANAKIILNQSDSGGLKKVQTFSLYNNTAKFDNDSTYTVQNFPNEFNPGNNQADSVTYYLESSLSTSDGTGYARLTNATDNTPLATTEINVNTFGLVRTRSGDLTSALPQATKDLDLELKNSNTYTTGSNVSWLITEIVRYPDPQATFTVAGVNAGETHNGITTSENSTVATLPFATLIPGSPKFLAHLINATTNSAQGYTVTTKLINYLQGNDSANNIDAFPGSWSNPLSWASPNSTTPNNNTGWLGANTSDVRVPGWSGASAKFGGLQYNNDYIVMFSSGPDAGTSTYVSYALEVNIFQPPDGYTGTIRYNFLPTY